MVTGHITITNPYGLHLRPAGFLCRLALEYESAVSMRKGTTVVNAKSVLGVLGACVRCGDEVEFICEGRDESEALNAIMEAAKSGFGDGTPGPAALPGVPARGLFLTCCGNFFPGPCVKGKSCDGFALPAAYYLRDIESN